MRKVLPRKEAHAAIAGAGDLKASASAVATGRELPVPVSVAFSDGTTSPATEELLRRCVRQLREAKAATKGRAVISDAPLVSFSQEKALARRKTAKENAAGPRAPITKVELEAYRDKYEKDEGKTRGWKQKACDDLLIDRKTLDARMKEK